MTFTDFKRAINVLADNDLAQVYIEQEIARDVFLQTGVSCIRKESNNGAPTIYIISGSTGDQV